MRTFGGLCLSLLLAGGLFAQNRSGFVNAGPPFVRTFPSAVFPGGTSALPGVQRTTGSVVFPGGSSAQIGVPGVRLNNMAGVNGFNGNFNNGFNNGFNGNGFRNGFNGNNGNGFKNGFKGRNFNNGFNNGGVVTTYAYPVAVPVPAYGGGYGPGPDGSYYDQPMPAAPQQPGNVIVIMPPGQAAPTPGQMQMMMMGPQGQALPPQAENAPQTPPASSGVDSGQVASHYLIAFKDHSIFSAVAYWVEGDTLHYFTDGSTHNQVSLSLVDRDLTKRLNEESGLRVNLPAAK